jgi:CubicO group peptidase (beta-lactamase class C family)
MPDLGVYFAAGLYGQYIFVSPEDDIVAVFTSGYGASDVDENPSMFRNYILDAVSDEQPGFPLEFVVPILVIAAVVSLVVIVGIRSRTRVVHS